MIKLITTTYPSQFWSFGPLFPLSASFTSSSPWFDESYLVAGQTVTVTQIQQMPAPTRTIQHWLILVDWDLHRQRPYVVVDPYDPQGLLYLSRTEYLSQLKVWASNDLAVMVIARPGSAKPTPVSADSKVTSSDSSQNSPPGSHFDPQERNSKSPLSDRSSRISWKTFLDLRKYVLRNVSVKDKMVSVTAESVGQTVYLWARELLHYAEVKNPGRRLTVFTPFVKHLQTLLKNNGSLYTVARMKIYLFVLYNFVMGNPLPSTEPLGIRVRLRNGLPSFLDKEIRGEIRRGDMQIIRVVASMFNIYRALRATSKPVDYSTITAPHPDFSNNDVFKRFQYFCKEVFPALVKEQFKAAEGKDLPPFKYETGSGLLIRSAGANLSGPSILSMQLDALAWARQQKNHVVDWFAMHQDTSMKVLLRDLPAEVHFKDVPDRPDWYGHTFLFPEKLPEGFMENQGVNRIPWVAPEGAPGQYAISAESFALYVGGVSRTAWKSTTSPILGRLHLIPEAAGKVRIVAICDYWTQVALKPVHEHLFLILKGLRENDATFDQGGVTRAYYQKGYKPHWSYDLKAATDTIPLALYKEVLTPFLQAEGETEEQARKRVDLWASILTDRTWQLPDGEFIRYGTGQPMGALSSWASLALTHHAIVQFSAWFSDGGRGGSLEDLQQVAKTWYKPYLILGDDVDLAESKACSSSYVEVCDTFKVKIGIAKSIHSVTNGFEFANQRFCDSGEISPLSLKEELAALTWTGRMELANRILARFGTKSKDEVVGLIRKVTTAPQWEALQPELTGTRSEYTLRFVKYCLLNPFYLSLRGKLELNIDSIVNWISLVIPDIKRHPIMESLSETMRLEHALVNQISESVKAKWRKKVADIPVSWSCKPRIVDDGGHEQIAYGCPLNDNVLFLKSLTFIKPFGSKIWDSKKGSWISPPANELEAYKAELRSKLHVPHRAPNTFMYLLFCVDEHNRMVMRKLDELYDSRIQEAVGKIPLSHILAMRKEGFKYSSLIEEWVSIWAELEALPKPITIDLNNIKESLQPETLSQAGVSRLKGGEKKPTTVELVEKLYGPMREVCGFLTANLGYVVPGLPFFSDGRKGKAWLRELRLAVDAYLQTQASQVQSPFCWPEASGNVPDVVRPETELTTLLRESSLKSKL